MRAPGAPEPRVTLSAAVLSGAISRHIVITGPEKREALDQVRTDIERAKRDYDLQRAAELEGRAVGEAISAFDRSIYAEVVFLMKLFFFVYLGLTLQFESARPYVVAGTLVAAIYAARTVLTRFTFPRELPARDAGVAAVMAPKGLAAAVIASAVAEQLPEIGPQLKELTFAVVLVSIVATSVLVPLVDVPGVRGVVGWWFGGYRPK